MGPARRDLDRAAALGNTGDAEVEHVAAYHRGLLLIRDGEFAAATALLRETFPGEGNSQVEFALGLAALRVPLLPAEVDPTHEAALREVGHLVAGGTASLPAFAAYNQAHADDPGR